METFLHTAVNLQFYRLLSEGEELQQQAPADEQQHDDKREHEHHPLTKSETHIQAFGVVQVLQGDVVRRRTDRRTHTTEVGSYGNRHGQGDTSLTLGGQLTEYGSQEREHHSGSSRVRHEHRE